MKEEIFVFLSVTMNLIHRILFIVLFLMNEKLNFVFRGIHNKKLKKYNLYTYMIISVIKTNKQYIAFYYYLF